MQLTPTRGARSIRFLRALLASLAIAATLRPWERLAGIGSDGEFGEASASVGEYNAVIDINMRAVVTGMHVAINMMRKTPSPSPRLIAWCVPFAAGRTAHHNERWCWCCMLFVVRVVLPAPETGACVPCMQHCVCWVSFPYASCPTVRRNQSRGVPAGQEPGAFAQVCWHPHRCTVPRYGNQMTVCVSLW